MGKEVTIKTFRQAVLQIGVPLLLAGIVVNAYLAISYLRQIEKTAALTSEQTNIQSQISNVLRDLTDMETGQRGYLLTENASYLQPYNDAKSRIGADFSNLRAGLSHRPENERSLESQLESLATSKQAEIERSITMRQQGYRHRAFMLVNSNEGMEYMEKARELLSSLSASENSSFASAENERNAGLHRVMRAIIISNLCLFALTASLLGLTRYHVRVLESEAASNRETLVKRDVRLGMLTSALSDQVEFTSAIESNARLLLQNYGGFLPRQGHEHAEQIEQAAAQMEQRRQQLVGGGDSVIASKAA
ncbi:MAG: hypothetical protein NVS9B5_32030 [Terriglobales bacterium]